MTTYRCDRCARDWKPKECDRIEWWQWGKMGVSYKCHRCGSDVFETTKEEKENDLLREVQPHDGNVCGGNGRPRISPDNEHGEIRGRDALPGVQGRGGRQVRGGSPLETGGVHVTHEESEER